MTTNLVQPQSLLKLSEFLRSGVITLDEHRQAVCERLAEVEPTVQALVPDEADRCERFQNRLTRLANSVEDPLDAPALYGVPLGVKDIFHVIGYQTRAGSTLPPAELTGPEATIVQRFKDAGAVVLGKTVTTEFAYFEPGPTRNPHNPAHTPGGSSSGSAAAVAAGLVPLAIGSQTIGSVIRPAAYCGVVGFKPSYNRIPTAGMLYVSRALDHVGLFTADVPSMRLAAAVACDDWLPAKTKPHHAPILGVPDGPYLNQADPVGQAALTRQIETLADAGYTIVRVNTFADIAAWNAQHVRLMAAEMAREHAAWWPTYRANYRPRTTAMIEDGLQVDDPEVAQLGELRHNARQIITDTMLAHHIDVWLSPAAPGPAPKGLASTGNPMLNLPWTLAGLPTVTVPAGTIDGLPLGLQLSGHFNRDEALLDWAADIAMIVKNI